ncbi:acyltransferase family protein [Pseudomonas cichorii]|uniref:acyltransferase family protein n=1 Tax=Pseudomonas cichorii TaxID=36746 RepID=UPI001C8959BA|nr:acyltransferase family protein [Pseudomonas cichorii]MBX8575465.1 acyltransferase [Pseudomonas cichorii]
MEYKELKTAAGISLKGYRPDIDGMRALAILSVVIFHAFPSVLGGGFVGVDIFFVISGYLISGIIFKDLDAGRFSFYRFYAHRVKRIFPAFLVVLPFSLAAGWFLLLPDEFRQLGKHAAASVIYIQNFALAGEAGYFDIASDLKPLNHMWSLAVEEQFYLLFPVVVFFAYRVGLNLATLLVLGMLVSFFLNVKGVRADPGAAYYLPQIRFWELLAGSLLAYINMYGQNLVSKVRQLLIFNSILFSRVPAEAEQKTLLNNFLSFAGVFLVGVSLKLIEQGYSFPGWWGIGPVLGAFLIIFGGPEAWFNRVVLSNRLMVFIGLISYPLYLWHWPLLSFAHIISSGMPSEMMRWGIVAASFFLAWLTYLFIEKPIRTGLGGRLKVFILIALSGVLGFAGFYTWKQDGFPTRLEAFEKVSKAAGEWAYPADLKAETFNGIDFHFKKSGAESTTIYVGDSNIQQYYPRIGYLIDTDPASTNSAIFKTGGGCFLVPGQKYYGVHAYCEEVMREAMELVKTYPHVDRVVIGAQWFGYLYSIYKNSPSIQQADTQYNEALDSLSDMIKLFKEQGKKVYLVTNIPIGNELDPKYVASRVVSDFPNIFQMRTGGVDRAYLESKYGKFRKDLIRIGSVAGAEVVDPFNYLCADRCDSVDALGNPIYKDATHLRPTFVRESVHFLDSTIAR